MAERKRKDWDQIHRAITENQPVNIENAIIEVGAQLRHGTVARELSLRNCVIRGTLSFNFVTFGESVSFRDTVFEDGIDLTGCRIEGQFVNHGVEFRGKAEFEGLSVGGHAFFERVVFCIAPNFTLTSWGSFTSFSSTKFDHGAKFLSATFGGHAIFENDTQAGGAAIDFTLATINGMLLARGSRFEQPLLLVRVRTTSDVRIAGIEFGSSAMLDLYHARIGGDLAIEECRFLNDRACLRLDGVQVDGGASIKAVNCRGDMSALDARFRSHLMIWGYPKEEGGKADRISRFDGNFSLGGSDVDDFFTCQDTAFKGEPSNRIESKQEEKPIDFSGMKCGDDVQILRCEFKRAVQFNRSQFAGVFGTDSRFDGELMCQGVQFHGAVRILPDCTFGNGATFDFCSFDTEANVGGAIIRVGLALLHSKIQTLLFTLPYHGDVAAQFDDDAKFRLEGSTCEAIGQITADRLKKLIGKIPDVPSEDASLVILEQLLGRSGRQDEADMIRRYRFKRCGRRLSWGSRNWWKLLGIEFYRLSNNYGTIAWPMLVVALLTGVATVAAPMVAGLDSDWREAAKTIFGFLSVVFLGLGMEPVKRRLWP